MGYSKLFETNGFSRSTVKKTNLLILLFIINIYKL